MGQTQQIHVNTHRKLTFSWHCSVQGTHFCVYVNNQKSIYHDILWETYLAKINNIYIYNFMIYCGNAWILKESCCWHKLLRIRWEQHCVLLLCTLLCRQLDTYIHIQMCIYIYVICVCFGLWSGQLNVELLQMARRLKEQKIGHMEPRSWPLIKPWLNYVALLAATWELSLQLLCQSCMQFVKCPTLSLIR